MPASVLNCLTVDVRAPLLPNTSGPFKHSHMSIVVLGISIIALCTNGDDIAIVATSNSIAKLIEKSFTKKISTPLVPT